MVRIEIAPLKAGLHEIVLQPSAEAVELDPEAFKDIQVTARLDVHRERILVMLQARATATLECDRTLVLFDQPIEGSYSLLFVPPDFVRESDDEFEEVRELLPSDQEIDLTDAVRDTLLLALPVRRVAPGAEDEDLPTRFGDEGEEESIDPRWEALRKLKAEDKN